MCDVCEGKMTLPELYERNEKLIEKYGHAVIGVAASTPEKSFSYSVGLADGGLPELVCIGVVDTSIINAVAQFMKKRERAVEDGELVSIGGTYPLKIAACHDAVKKEMMTMATRHAKGKPFAAMQLVLCDTTGVFPDEPGCAYPFNQVPYLTTEESVMGFA